MPEHRTGTRDEWLAARQELLAAEKEHIRHGDELARRREQLPWVAVEKEYTFETPDGTRTLSDLFDGRSQLLVYHFMFGFGMNVRDETEGCTGCSFVADHFDAVIPHLNGHDVTLVCSSIAPLERLEGYRARMGWGFPWVSALGSDFHYDFGVAFTMSSRQMAPTTTTSTSRRPARSARGSARSPSRTTRSTTRTRPTPAGWRR